MGLRKLSAGVGLYLIFGAAGVARADCPFVDFESFTVGTAITNQIPGVTFSVTPQTCPGTINTLVSNPWSGGTSSGTKMLRVGTGCPDFSDEKMRMVFSS